ELQAERERLARHYHRRLTGIPGITAITQFLRQPDRHSWCMFVVSIEEEAGVSRDAVIDYCKQSNIGTSVHYIPTHRFTAYKDLPARLPVTDMIWKRILSLPLYPGMTLQDVDDVVEAIVRVAQSAEVKASVA
ncbi:MAG: DegT/DnrJ/EryC1/StrS family aminotransferase, partial [Vulcanimicrobiaceae bacterium]